MITDEKTNFLYVADSLPNLYPQFWKQFEPVLKVNRIRYDLLPGTNDIWCRDFMPLQINKEAFVQFVYQPGYLQTKKYKPTISDPGKICQKIGIAATNSNLKLEGGNVVRTENKAILTDKIFSENPHISKSNLLSEIQELLQVETLFVIPKQPFDFTGHADGMVRFLDNETVLTNEFDGYPNWFQSRIKSGLKKTGLKLETIIYKPSDEKDSAIGTYINYLQIGNFILLPIFEKLGDEIAYKQLSSYFPSACIVPVNANDIAKDGGVLNCITWNIEK